MTDDLRKPQLIEQLEDQILKLDHAHGVYVEMYDRAKEEITRLRSALALYESYLRPLSILQPENGIDKLLAAAKEIILASKIDFGSI